MQGNDSYRLIVRRGPQPNQIYELKEDVINLGRDITNNIVINDREVSRHHLRFMRGAEGYTVEDLGSTNGTFVNGKRVTGATLLKNGDMLGLGETVTLGYELMRGDVGGYSPAPMPDQPQEHGPERQYPAQEQRDPYRPPAQQPPAPYQQPADPYQQQDQPYQPAYQDQGYYQQPGVAPYGAPPPPGYDYDPYAMREDEGGQQRILLFGCLGVMLFCCCITVAAVVAVDTLNLYCDIPGLRNFLQAVGLLRC